MKFSIVRFAIFLCLALAILAGLHLFVFISIESFLPLANTGIVPGIIMGSLSVSFIIFLIASHRNSNRLLRFCYYVSGLWVGLFVNIVTASILAWTAAGVGVIFGFIMPKAVIEILYGAALLATLVGAWNALHFKIQTISVAIPGLPSNWKGKKIIQISDLHLGPIYGEKWLERMVKSINALEPEIIVITGDLFDGGDMEGLSRLVSPLRRLRPARTTFFVTGNHENYIGTEKIFSAMRNLPVEILKNSVRDLDGLKVIGISYPEEISSESPVPTLKALQKEYFGSPNILLFHSPIAIKEIEQLGINLELCGHTHRAQIYPFNLLTDLIFHGLDYGLYRHGSYSLYTSLGLGSWGPAVRTTGRPEIVVVRLE